MGVTQFPPAASGGGLSNDFILRKAGSADNTFALPREFAAGGYNVSLSTGDTSFDIYLINAGGSAVGYTNGASIVASENFDTVVVLGVGTAEQIAFSFAGPSTDPTSSGLEPGAGAYLTSVLPSDLAQIDDTAVVSGGNFAAGLELSFRSGTVTLAAKNVVVGSSTAAVVTRPDELIEDLSPWDLIAINPGVDVPTGSTANVLSGTVTAGTDPSFITTSPILGAVTNTAFSTAILVSDTEGTVVNWAVSAGTLPTGLTLGTADGTLAGTPTVGGNYTFTVTITDDGNNTNSREFELPVGLIVTAPNSTAVGGVNYAWFTASDDLVITNNVSTNIEYLVIAGGGGGASQGVDSQSGGGGGGAGGLLLGTAVLSNGTATVTIGSGGAVNSDGVNTVISGVATAVAGGGGRTNTNGGSGGSGAGASDGYSPGTAVLSGAQGNNGGNEDGDNGGGGGGAGAVGGNALINDYGGAGGAGSDFSAWASAIGIVFNGGYFAGGGGGGGGGAVGTAGIGGGGQGASLNPGNSSAGSANSGGGGGAGFVNPFVGNKNASAGGSGLVVLRWS